jgi:hypothetical protein
LETITGSSLQESFVYASTFRSSRIVIRSDSRSFGEDEKPKAGHGISRSRITMLFYWGIEREEIRGIPYFIEEMTVFKAEERFAAEDKAGQDGQIPG